jgi:hypothetical protein
MNFHAMCKRCLILLSLLVVASGCASSPEQKQFASPQAATKSLVDALRKNDQTRLRESLGPDADDILASGDKVADQADVQRFLSLYDTSHRFQTTPDGVTTLLVGQDDWPFPVPIVKSGSKYVFDTETGKDEVLNRRIGRNELASQQVCLAIVDAQRDYVRLNPMGSDLPEYARKAVSDPGTKNGLYWPTADGEPESPLGPLAASATAQGYGGSAVQKEGPRPYHGYQYRLLTSQGTHAEGGAMEYMVNGHLIGGFGVVAYPAQYGNSGIMTFITNHDGVVYQRDLGPDTQKIAEHMNAFDPGPGWTKTADDSQVTLGD